MDNITSFTNIHCTDLEGQESFSVKQWMY